MRAAVCSGLNERLAIEDVELRKPGAREVVVRIDATAVCVTDALAIGGFTLVEPPFINGHAAAGVIEEVGSDNARLRCERYAETVGP